MTCGNISKDIRTKASAKCWVLVAQIPVAKFLQKTHQTVLAARLYHHCMNIIFDTMKACSRSPILMPDPRSDLRLVGPYFLLFWADHPEMQLISCTSFDASPLSFARHKHLGLGASPTSSIWSSNPSAESISRRMQLHLINSRSIPLVRKPLV